MIKEQIFKLMDEILGEYEFEKIKIKYAIEDKTLKIEGICEFEPVNLHVGYTIGLVDEYEDEIEEDDLKVYIRTALEFIKGKFWDFLVHHLGYKFDYKGGR